MGGEDERVLLDGEGTLDGPTDTITYQPTISAASATTITVAGSLTGTRKDYIGTPIAAISGTGKGQLRVCNTVVSLAGGRLGTIAWNTTLDTTSKLQIAAIEYQAKFGVEQYILDEQDNQREVRVQFSPTTNAANMDLRIYEDYNTAPENQGITHTDDLGVRAVIDEPDVVIPMKSRTANDRGFARYSFDNSLQDYSDTERAIQLEVRGFQNREQVKIKGIEIRGAK